MSKIYLEILDKKRQNIFQTLSHFKKRGYLAGGTALALQIKHRLSLDFDIFIKKPVDNHLRRKVKTIFPHSKSYIDTSDQISFQTKDNISITFVWYDYPRLFQSVSTSALTLAHPLDIAADKALTIGRRAIWRDYVDIYFLIQKEVVGLAKIIALAEKKFSGEFNQALFLEQLVYFKDLKVQPIKFIESSPAAEQIKSFLEEQVDKYLKKVLGS